MNTLQKIFIASISIPFIIAVVTVFSGHIPFWYDPARDLLSASADKLTLIGPTSGIPGIFYGPYWIWLLGFGQLFSQDPAVIIFITATLPYFVLFPFIWSKFARFFGMKVIIICWILFACSSGLVYGTSLWNPHPAPLITLTVLYLLLRNNFTKNSKLNLGLSLITGFLSGVLINFHISFGIAFFLGITIFLLWTFWQNLKAQEKKHKAIIRTTLFHTASFMGGIIAAFIPGLLFEIRHGFNQTQTIMHAFSKYGDVVQTTGLDKGTILSEFFISFGKLLQLSGEIGALVLIILLVLFIMTLKKKNITLTPNDKKIIALVLSLFAGVSFIYFTARNPVWEYHFIGVEIFFLILLALLLSKMRFISRIFVVASCFVMIYTITQAGMLFTSKDIPDYNIQKEIVKTIATDAAGQDYAVYSYSTSIYMYEYSYLFKWLANKDMPYDPGLVKPSDTIYLITPSQTDSSIIDFTHFRTPEKIYKYVKNWKQGKMTISKSVKKK